MRLSLAATAAVTAAAGLVTTLAPAPAMAGPIKSPVLTNNALYRTGQFASGACRTPAMPNRGHAAVKSYLTTSFTCVNSAWAKHLSASGMALSRPGFTYFTKGDSPFCQVKAKDIMPGAYCNPTRTIGVILPQPVREYAPEVGFMLVMAHEYGHHVQNSMGMLAAASKERYPSRKAALEASRRYELQADCLAGVYISSIWDSQRRSVPEWGRSSPWPGRWGREGQQDERPRQRDEPGALVQQGLRGGVPGRLQHMDGLLRQGGLTPLPPPAGAWWQRRHRRHRRTTPAGGTRPGATGVSRPGDQEPKAVTAGGRCARVP